MDVVVAVTKMKPGKVKAGEKSAAGAVFARALMPGRSISIRV